MQHPHLEGRRKTWQLLLAAGLAPGAAMDALAAVAAPTTLIYPLTSEGVDSRYDYEWAVLRTALEKSSARFGRYDVQRTQAAMSPPRVLHEMGAGQGKINVFVRATSPELERQFLPVRLPVDRGLLGYRLLLIRAADQDRYTRVRTVADLARLRAGLGQGWPDVQILQAAGIPVVEGSSYNGLFSMLDAHRFDFYLRSIDEATREIDERQDQYPHMAIEQTLLVHYPLARYFFLRRDAEGALLAQRIEAGMEMMIRDGTLNTLFMRYKGDLIRKARLAQRHTIRIANPLLGPNTPLGRQELWFNPLTGK
jgi:ABC-type amino acid transport substrate-binding protein